MLNKFDLSFYPYLNYSAIWNGIPQQETSDMPVWQWSPLLKLTHDGDLDTINQFIADGWQRLEGDHWESGEINAGRYLRMVSQLADVRLLRMPGQGEHELWARTEDIHRADAIPVTLSFARTDIASGDYPGAVLGISERGVITLHVAQPLPPPQFGELAMVDHSINGQRVWQVYTLSALGDDGLALWQRMSEALKALATPGEWWLHTTRLEACLRGEYAQLREGLRSKLLATKGPERELWRVRLAQIEVDRKHAEALRTARERAHADPAAWLERWQEIRGMAAELAALYWAAHQQAVSVPATADADTELGAELDLEPVPPAEPMPVSEEADMIAQLIESNAASMDTPSYAEDRAVREAALAPKATWHTEADIPRYNASNNLAVYFHNPEHPLSLADAQAQLLRVRGEGTVLTVRIAQGLWNLRRHDAKLGRNGAALIAYNDILRWRGVAKHSRAVSPGSERRVTDGWRTEDREDVRRDFELASSYYLRGQHTVTYKDKRQTVNVDGPYMKVSFISVPTLWGEEPVGVWFTPGDWINSYEDAGNYYLAEVDRRVFELNPQNEQHELKLALYLTELWRYQARKGRYDQPLTMAELLQLSVITVDRNMLTSRFAPRIENALAKLRDRGIIGAYECLTPVDKSKGKWGQAWLASLWRILPPDTLRQSYVDKDITRTPRLGPGPGRPKGKRQ